MVENWQVDKQVLHQLWNDILPFLLISLLFSFLWQCQHSVIRLFYDLIRLVKETYIFTLCIANSGMQRVIVKHDHHAQFDEDYVNDFFPELVSHSLREKLWASERAIFVSGPICIAHRHAKCVFFFQPYHLCLILSANQHITVSANKCAAGGQKVRDTADLSVRGMTPTPSAQCTSFCHCYAHTLLTQTESDTQKSPTRC